MLHHHYMLSVTEMPLRQGLWSSISWCFWQTWSKLNVQAQTVFSKSFCLQKEPSPPMTAHEHSAESTNFHVVKLFEYRTNPEKHVLPSPPVPFKMHPHLLVTCLNWKTPTRLWVCRGINVVGTTTTAGENSSLELAIWAWHLWWLLSLMVSRHCDGWTSLCPPTNKIPFTITLESTGRPVFGVLQQSSPRIWSSRTIAPLKQPRLLLWASGEDDCRSIFSMYCDSFENCIFQRVTVNHIPW